MGGEVFAPPLNFSAPTVATGGTIGQGGIHFNNSRGSLWLAAAVAALALVMVIK